MSLITANNIEINTEQHGDPQSTAILLIRGLGSQLIHWPNRMINGLVDAGFQVITFDNRDTGLSEKFTSFGLPDFSQSPVQAAYSLKDMADDAIGVLDHYNIEHAHILGISMGGMILQILAAHYPQRLKTATIVMSSSGTTDAPALSEEAQAMLALSPKDPNDRDCVIETTLVSDRFFGSPGFPFKDSERADLIGRAFDRCHCPAGVARQFAAIATAEDRQKLLQNIVTPCLVIHGRDDRLLPIEHGQDIAAKIPKAHFVGVEGMGHDLEGEIPDIIIREFTKFQNDLQA